jgi:HK97 gp10 family phage protein
MADFELQIDGLADLERKLLAIGGNAAQRSLNKGLRGGANVVLKEARRRVRKKTGNTAKKTTIKNSGVTGQDQTYSIVTNYVGRFLEFGTSKMPAYPFLRPAAEAVAAQAVETMRDMTFTQLDIEIAKA